VDVLVLGGGGAPPEDAIAVMASRARVLAVAGVGYGDFRDDEPRELTVLDRLHRDADVRDRYRFGVLGADGAAEYRNWFKAVNEAATLLPRKPAEPATPPTEGKPPRDSLADDAPRAVVALPSERRTARLRLARMGLFTFLEAAMPNTGAVVVYYILDHSDVRPAQLTFVGAIGAIAGAGGAWLYSHCVCLSGARARAFLLTVSLVLLVLSPVDWLLIWGAPQLSTEQLLAGLLAVAVVGNLIGGTTGPVLSHASASAALEGRETATYSMLMTLNNCGVGLSGLLSSALAAAAGVRRGDYGEDFMQLVVGVGAVTSVVGMALLFLPVLESDVSGGGYGRVADSDAQEPDEEERAAAGSFTLAGSSDEEEQRPVSAGRE
jgi:hypothetical protein